MIGTPELAQRLLVALELPAARGLVLRVARLDPLGQLVERERAAGVEQGRGEVEQPLEPVSHRPGQPSTMDRRQRAGGGGGLEQRGVVLGRAPHRLHPQVVAGEQLERVGRVDVDQLVPAVDARGVEIGGQACRLLGVVELGHRHQHALAGGEAQRGGGVVRQPVVARPLVGERHAQARDRHPAERGRRRRGWCRPPCR